MTNRADVRSLSRLEEFHLQAETFRNGLLKELERLLLELRRMTNWIEQDAIGYWSEQSVQAERHWAECRDRLTRCQAYVRADEQRPCTEEKKRLRRAEQRLELCQQKLRLSQAALSFWQSELSKQSAHITRCQDLAESSLRVACLHLRGQIELLQNYAQLRTAPRVTDSAASASTNDPALDPVSQRPTDASPSADPPAAAPPTATPPSSAPPCPAPPRRSDAPEQQP